MGDQSEPIASPSTASHDNHTDNGKLSNLITSGPMSEGHIRLDNPPPRLSNSSQNLCIFTGCLFVMGLTLLVVGYYLLFVAPNLFYIWVVMIVIGGVSFVSALLYSLVYLFVHLWQMKLSSSRSTSRTPTASATSGHPKTNGTVAMSHAPIASDNEEFAWLNVNNLDYEIQSTKNLEAEVWSTVPQSELPQNYLNSFGDLATLPSPNGDIRSTGIEGKQNQRSRGRGLLESFSLRSRAPYAKRMSDSQATLLDHEAEAENTLFNVQSIATPPSARPDGADDTPSSERIVLTNGSTNPSIVVVHYNKHYTSSPPPNHHSPS